MTASTAAAAQKEKVEYPQTSSLYPEALPSKYKPKALALAAAAAAKSIQQVALPTLQTTASQSKAVDKLFLKSCLKQLQPLFGEVSIDTLEFLAVEEVIELGLKEILFSLLKNKFSKSDIQLLHLINVICNWKTRFPILKSLYTYNAQRLFENDKSSIEMYEKHLNVLLLLIQRPECHSSVLSSPMDPKTRLKLSEVYDKSIERFELVFRFFESFSIQGLPIAINALAQTTYVSNIPAMKNRVKYSKPRNVKVEVLKMLGSRLIVSIAEFSLVFEQNSQHSDYLKKAHSRMLLLCDRTNQQISEFKRQHILIEKQKAILNTILYSEDSKDYFKRFLVDMSVALDKFYVRLIQRFREIMHANTSKDVTEDSSKCLHYCQRFYNILSIELRIFSYRFQTGLPDRANSEIPKLISDYSKKQQSALEELEKEKCDPKFVRQLCEVFTKEMQDLLKEMVLLETKYYSLDPLMISPGEQFITRNYYFMVVIDQMYDFFENLIPISSKANLPARQSAFGQVVTQLEFFRKEHQKDFSTRDDELKEVMERFRIRIEGKLVPLKDLRCDESDAFLVMRIRDVVDGLSGMSAGITLFRNSFLQSRALSQQENKLTNDELNEQERAWAQWLDADEEQPSPAITASAAQANTKETAVATKKIKSKSKNAKLKQKASTKTNMANKGVAEQSFSVDHYTTSTSRNLAIHRHFLRRYYKVPDYIITPISLVEQPFTPSEIALQQQILSTDCLQWVIGMLEVSTEPKIRQLLTTYFFWWLHLATEQSHTSEFVKRNPNSPLTHNVDKLNQLIGANACQRLLKHHLWGTDYVRYPFTVPKPTKGSPTAYRHVTEPSETSVKEVMCETEDMVKDFVQIQNSVMASSKANEGVASTAALTQQDTKSAAAKSGSVSSATASAIPKVTPMTGEIANELKEQMRLLQIAQSKLTVRIDAIPKNTFEYTTLRPVLQNAQFHLNNLMASIALVIEQPLEECLFVQMTMAYLSTQYFCENLGDFMSLQIGVDRRRHDLMKYALTFGLGNYKEEILDELKKVNLGKGSEYLFKKQCEEALETIRYLSGLFATSKYFTLAKEGIRLPQSNGERIDIVQKEMAARLKILATLTINLINTHFP